VLGIEGNVDLAALEDDAGTSRTAELRSATSDRRSGGWRRDLRCPAFQIAGGEGLARHVAGDVNLDGGTGFGEGAEVGVD
jgi:hypothetical protein